MPLSHLNSDGFILLGWDGTSVLAALMCFSFRAEALVNVNDRQNNRIEIQ
jgi:hypothetical protein